MDDNMKTEHQIDHKKVAQTLRINKVWIPLLLGIGMLVYQLTTDPELKIDQLPRIWEAKIGYVLLAIATVIIRDIMYIYRIRILTNASLSWSSCIHMIVLWEFSSAVTPTAVGGTFIATFLFLKEGISFSKALAYVLITSIFDNLFLILTAPFSSYFAANNLIKATTLAENSIQIGFWISYTMITCYIIMISVTLFAKPRFFKWALIKITSIKPLRRWKVWAVKQGNEMMMASEALKGESASYWMKLGIVTLLVWTARYGILNALIAAYVPVTWLDHVIIFEKQIILWVTMLISPTPGSSGTAEFCFKKLYGDLLGQYTLITTILWRTITYYLYLFAGIIVLPRWLKKRTRHV